MTQKHDSEQTRIMIPPIMVTEPERKVPLLLNELFCQEILPDMFYQYTKCFLTDFGVKSALYCATQRLLTQRPEMQELPKEYENLQYRIFKRDDDTLVIVIVPLDAWLMRYSCNMVGFYIDGDKKVIFTSEYYFKSHKFKLSYLGANKNCKPFGQTVETIEDFKDAIYKVIDEHWDMERMIYKDYELDISDLCLP